MLYLDTSALLKLYIREQGSEAVQSRVVSQDHPLPIWEIQKAELINALRLKVFWKEITLEQAETQVALFENRLKRGLYAFPEIDRNSLMKCVLRLGAETPRLGCRTMDILHVAFALEIGASEFLSFDQRQNALAAHTGLKLTPLP
ncbi:MAG: type II toxin-antitoxin system VapC family toxin [Luteolibacter sp.]|jgi:predicted nucleic acid-binding protein|nr:type II toxin-antitoxin system VapC family toxin [Luteolibacter sp.]